MIKSIQYKLGALGPRLTGMAVVAAAGFSLLIWAGTPIVTKIAVTHVDAVTVGILRTVMAAALVAPLVFILGPRLPRPRSHKHIAFLMVSTFGGFVAFPVLFSVGVGYTSSSHAALIIAAAPIFSGLLAAIAARRAPSWRWWLGVAIAALGEYLLVGFRLGFAAQGGVIGDLLVLASCLAAAVGYVSGGALSRVIGARATTLWGVTFGGLALLPLLAWRAGEAAWSGVDATGWLAIAYLALGSTLLAYVCWYWAMGKGGIARVTAWQFAQPVMSVVLAALILDERITLPLALAAALILFGLWLAQRNARG